MPDPLLSIILGCLVLMFLGLIFWPDHGLLIRWRRAQQLSQRVLTEDALKHIYKLEVKGEYATLQSVSGTLQISANQAAELLDEMQQLELVSMQGNHLRLTAEGASAALHVIRAHRLWERYLAEESGFHEADWHDQADIQEHRLTPEAAQNLSARLGHPTHDPHGDPIPSESGEFQPHGGQPLTAFNINDFLQIVHIEDEPETVYAQLVAEGLFPGTQLRITKISPQRIRFLANGDDHLLAPIIAANLSVSPVENEAPIQDISKETLDMLKLGESAEIVRISGRVRGLERRRMMDMGILPGTRIQVELKGPVGDPRAYRVKGALVALRKEQASQISVRRVARHQT